MGREVTSAIKAEWLKTAPKIIAVAQEEISANSNLSKFLSSHNLFDQMNTGIEHRCI